MKKILLFLSFVFAIFLNIDSTHAETVPGVTYPFSLTTTSLNADDSFQFKISAAGTFYVDCGADGILSGTGANGGTITKSDTTEYTYTCTYSSGTAKTIQFGGTATGYSTTYNIATISFDIDGSFPNVNTSKISSISGSLGQIFGTVENPVTGTTGQPKFYRTFHGAINMMGTNIDDPNNPGMKYALPPTLFDGISGAPAPYMFAITFDSCYGLTGSIPSGLFGNISGAPAPYMFYATFWVCDSLTGSIPSNLFGNLSGAPASYMFAYTFRGCSGLTGFGDKTYVPGDFLANVNTNTSVSNQAPSMFSNTQLAATCPAGTYASTRTQFNGAGKPWCTICPNGTTSNAGATDVSQCVVPHTITYACGSGSGDAPTATSAIPDSSFTPAANTCTAPTGHTFSNWLVSNTGTPGTTVSAGTAFNWTYSEDKTLTAQYTPNSLSLTFDGTTTMSCDYGGTFTVPPAPAPRRGYVFTGWVVNPQPAN